MAKRKGPGVGVSITLIVLGIIVAIYVVKSFIHSKSVKVYSIAAGNTAPVAIKKHHRKSHILKHKTTDVSAQAKSDSASNSAVQHIVSDFKHPASEKPKEPAPEKNIKTTDNKAPVITEKKASGNADYLFATYTRPNATGVTNMRQSDSYGAAVMATIPANAKVLVLERGRIYYRIFYDKQIGYIPKWALRQK